MSENMKAIEELMDGISPRPWDWTTHKREDGKPIESVEDVVGILALSARKGTGLELHGVGAKQGGEDIVICYTGNGPRSAANARFLANAPAAIDWLMSENARLRAEVEALKKELDEHKHYAERACADAIRYQDEKNAAEAEAARLRERVKAARKEIEIAHVEHEGNYKTPCTPENCHLLAAVAALSGEAKDGGEEGKRV